MRVLREAVLDRGDWPLLYDKLAISNTYWHAKNWNDPRPITLSKAAFLESGFSAVAILGGGWLQSPASDGPPWYLFCILPGENIIDMSGSIRSVSVFFNVNMSTMMMQVIITAVRSIHQWKGHSLHQLIYVLHLLWASRNIVVNLAESLN